MIVQAHSKLCILILITESRIAESPGDPSKKSVVEVTTTGSLQTIDTASRALEQMDLTE
jgi:hypothetical protein